MGEIGPELISADSDPEEVARAYVEMWNSQDHPAIPQLVSETFIMYDPAIPVKGVAGPKGEAHGRDGLRQFMELIATGFPDFEITILDMLAEDHLVMYEIRITMTHDGPLGGIPPTGRRVGVQGASVLRLDDGTIDEHRFYVNMGDIAEQLGLTFPAVIAQLPKLLLGKVRSAL